jgi:phage shock protein A
MRLFPRTRDIQMEGVEEILAGADEPAWMRRLIVKDIEQALIDVRAREAVLLRQARSLGRDAGAAEYRQAELTQQARHALVEDREDSARRALNEKYASIGDIAELRRRIDILNVEASAIATEVTRVETILAEVRGLRPLRET